MRVYNGHNTSKQYIDFKSPLFPAFFRLFKWKILDHCVLSFKSMEQIGDFARFEPLFGRNDLHKIVEKIMIDDEPKDGYTEKIAAANLDDKSRKQAEMYVQFRRRHSAKVQRRRFIEFFMRKVLYTEEGLRLADELLFDKDPELYDATHCEGLTTTWAAGQTFFQKFYDDVDQENRLVNHKLDKVAGSARGNLILPHFAHNSKTVGEFHAFETIRKETWYPLEAPLVRDALAEGPIYQLKVVEGEEKRVEAEKWTEHDTKMMFVAMIGFCENEKVEAGEHEEWYYHLLEAMRNDPHNRAALHFLNQNYVEELEARETERQRKSMLALRGTCLDEEGVTEEETVITMRPQETEVDYQTDADVTELKLRAYQEELVQPALERRNCVIVAPTGSGKTEVAIYAALHHIGDLHHRRKPARVVLLVPSIALVGQQKERVLKYCRGKYRVEGFHGSEESKTGKGRCDDVLQCHVAVMTPQILVNMLQSVRRSERLYISDFSMVVFDEVHRATGNHPYVEISRMIEEWAHEKPQIIGLTASLNVSTGQADLNAMKEGIYNMLAILNTPYLSSITKQENIDMLNSFVGKPDDSVEVCSPPADGEDPLRSFIIRTLTKYHMNFSNELDRLVKARHNNSFAPNFLKMFRNAKTERFEMYESLLQTVAQELNKMNTAEKAMAQMHARYLRVYVEARSIVEVMPPHMALEFMKEAFGKLDEAHKLKQFEEFSKNREQLEKHANEGTEPTIVKKLKETLISQFKSEQDSRVIIFVTQRSTAQRVADFLNRSKIMKDFSNSRDGDAIGYVLGVNNNGAIQQSAVEQTRVLDRFNNGKLKVLVATSVIEEGLDVTACNLIIKYNCSSGSAIQLIQQRGRARAKNSRSVLLAVNSAVNQRENNALLAEKCMKWCISDIGKKTQRQLDIEVDKCRERLRRERERREHERVLEQQRHANKSYLIKCAQCNLLFCQSTAMRKIYSNYMVMVPEIWDNMNLISRPRKVNRHTEDCVSLCNIHCQKCKTDIGKAYKMRGVYLPQLTVKALTFAPAHGTANDATETKGKWKDVEDSLFHIPEAVQSDYSRMLNAFSNSQANMEKKRLLDFDSKQFVKSVEIECYELDRKERQKQERKVQKGGKPVIEEEEEEEKKEEEDNE